MGNKNLLKTLELKTIILLYTILKKVNDHTNSDLIALLPLNNLNTCS